MKPFKFVVERTSLQHRLREHKDRRFDRKFDVNTDGTILLRDLDIDNPNREHGERYEAIDPDVFKRMLAYLQIKHQDFTFVDFGSGKGRALLLASEYPFKKIIGVELSPQLNEVAQKNIRAYKGAPQKCKDLTAVCIDATTFPIPAGNLLVFMANPFYDPVMSKVLSNIEKSIEADPRELYIVYSNPQCRHLFDKAEFLTKHTDKDWFVIYAHAAPKTLIRPI